MHNILIYIVSFTWCLIQNLVGLAVLISVKLFKKEYKTVYYKGTLVTYVGDNWGGISLGLFIFLSKGYSDDSVKHEYGHSIQSLILGPLYLPIIGLSSFILCKFFSHIYLKEKNGYYRFWTERWADKLGKVVRK